LERFDKKPDAEQLAILQKEGEAYAELFLTVLKHITDPLTTEYVLTLVDKYLTEDPTLCKAYSKLTTHLTLNPHAILFRNCQNADTLGPRYVNVVGRACHIAGMLMSAKIQPSDSVAQTFVTFMATQLQSTTASPIMTRTCVNNVFYALQMVLRDEKARLSFDENRGTGMLIKLLEARENHHNIQLLYQIVNSLWILSYSKPIAVVIQSELPLLQALVDVLKSVEKDKVLRNSLALLKNLCNTPLPAATATERRKRSAKEYLVDLGLLKVIEHLKTMNMEDEETVADMNWLEENLSKGLQEMSTFDEYRKEVLSNLHDGWTPVHKSVLFWHNNIHRFEDGKYEVVRKLVDIIDHDKKMDDRAVQIALHDIGMFIVHFPKGKKIIEDLKAKSKIMMYLADSNVSDDTRKEALMCVQKMMIYS